MSVFSRQIENCPNYQFHGFFSQSFLIYEFLHFFSGLTAIEAWMLACILFVFGALVEYAVILFRRQTAKDEVDHPVRPHVYKSMSQ